eukprot:4038942-Prymnesium_polylepis.1
MRPAPQRPALGCPMNSCTRHALLASDAHTKTCNPPRPRAVRAAGGAQRTHGLARPSGLSTSMTRLLTARPSTTCGSSSRIGITSCWP